MSQTMDGGASLPRWSGNLRSAFAAHGLPKGRIAMAQAPGAVDVMGGICEDRGSFVLTTTLPLSIKAIVWESAGADVRLIGGDETGAAAPRETVVPVSALVDGDTLADRCLSADADWASPAIEVLHRAFSMKAVPRPTAGLTILLHSDFPDDADLGRPCATATAVLDALCRLTASTIEPYQRAKWASEAAIPLIGLRRVRAAMTAFGAKGDGSLLQMRFRPQMFCEPLVLPPGVVITTVRTQLSRPTSRARMLETGLCAEMGERLLLDLRLRDGRGPDLAQASLAAITPVEYVENYRNRLPQKITGKSFTATFGTVRGLDGDSNGKAIYKLRSRVEHHIYESHRVQEFVSFIAMARRTGGAEALIEAGERMYASHWSHSQRCGIGGAEADRIAQAVRRRGPADGLYGAKVTGGGAGGEMVVLMRNDDRARTALAEAMKEAGEATHRSIEIYQGSLCGAESFTSPDFSALLAS